MKLQEFLQNRKEQHSFQPGGSKVLTDEDTQHPSTVMYKAGRGTSCVCLVVTLKEKILQSVYIRYPFENINERGLKSETALHNFIPARADILENQTQRHPK